MKIGITFDALFSRPIFGTLQMLEYPCKRRWIEQEVMYMIELIPEDAEYKVHYLVVVGMNEYKGKIKYVDGWFSEKEEMDNKYEVAIERVDEGLHLYDVNKVSNEFVTLCDSTTERDALQALAALINGPQFVGIDFWDIMLCSNPIMEFKTKTFAGDSFMSDVEVWIDSLKTKINPQNVRIMSGYGGMTVSELQKVAVKLLCEDVENTTQNCQLLSCVYDDNSIVQISLWIGEQGQSDYYDAVKLPVWL